MIAMADENAKELRLAHNRVDPTIHIKNTADLSLFTSLTDSIPRIKQTIQKNVPSSARLMVFSCIWFFSTVYPEVSQELIEYVEQWEAEKFVYCAYQHLFDALNIRKSHLTLTDESTRINPSQADVDKTIEVFRGLQNDLDTNNITWYSAPWGVPIGLLPAERRHFS